MKNFNKVIMLDRNNARSIFILLCFNYLLCNRVITYKKNILNLHFVPAVQAYQAFLEFHLILLFLVDPENQYDNICIMKQVNKFKCFLYEMSNLNK